MHSVVETTKTKTRRQSGRSCERLCDRSCDMNVEGAALRLASPPKRQQQQLHTDKGSYATVATTSRRT